MPIIFEPLTSTRTDAIGDGALYLLGFGYGPAITNDTAVCDGGFVLTGEALADETGLAEIVMPTLADGVLYLSVDGEGYVHLSAEADGGFAIGGEGYYGGTATYNGYADGGFVLRGQALQLQPIGAYGFLVEQPALMEGYGNVLYASMTSAAAFADAPSGSLQFVLRSLMRVVDSFSVAANLHATLSSNVRASDFFVAVFEARIDDTLAVADSLEAQAYMVALLADQLVVVDAMTAHLNALVAVASAMVMADALVAGFDGRIDEAFEFTDAMDAKINALVALASEVVMIDQLEAGMTLFAAVDDVFFVDDEPTASLSLLAQLLDGFSIGVRLRTPAGDEFAGYTLNVRNSAVSEYTNYNYNSLAMIGGKLYGASATGIYLLEGADDAGAPIEASVRLGMSDFGSNLLKKVPAAYVGYTSDGQLLLKVITSDRGVKKENHYRLAPRALSAPAEGRFTPAKGLVGMYWGFELTNVDGADFALDVIKVWPVALNRRYSGR